LGRHFAAVVLAKKTRLMPLPLFSVRRLCARQYRCLAVWKRLVCARFRRARHHSTIWRPVNASVFAETKRIIDNAYVQHPILNTEAFFTLMITAFLLNILVPLTITWWRPHYLKATSDTSYQADSRQ
jgi:hypothetical protein